MSVGQRFKAFLRRNCLSYRDVEEITKVVSKSQAARIVTDQCGPSLEHHIRNMVPRFQAAGYSITVEQLLEGLDPQGDFEGMIRNTGPEKRFDYVGMTLQERTYITLDFLHEHYPDKCPTDLVAALSQLEPALVDRLVAHWDDHVPDFGTALRLARALHRLAGISLEWFYTGWFSDETPADVLVDLIVEECHQALTTTHVLQSVRVAAHKCCLI